MGLFHEPVTADKAFAEFISKSVDTDSDGEVTLVEFLRGGLRHLVSPVDAHYAWLRLFEFWRVFEALGSPNEKFVIQILFFMETFFFFLLF
jgi:hypothetical protein